MAKKNKLEISLSLDNWHLIGADKTDVILQESCCVEDKNGADEPCLLYVNKKMFMQMITDWIQWKTDKCLSYDHFCGAGWAWVEKYKEIKQNMYLNLPKSDDEDEEEYVETPVKSYRCFEYGMEMEHG